VAYVLPGCAQNYTPRSPIGSRGTKPGRPAASGVNLRRPTRTGPPRRATGRAGGRDAGRGRLAGGFCRASARGGGVAGQSCKPLTAEAGFVFTAASCGGRRRAPSGRASPPRKFVGFFPVNFLWEFLTSICARNCSPGCGWRDGRICQIRSPIAGGWLRRRPRRTLGGIALPPGVGIFSGISGGRKPGGPRVGESRHKHIYGRLGLLSRYGPDYTAGVRRLGARPARGTPAASAAGVCESPRSVGSGGTMALKRGARRGGQAGARQCRQECGFQYKL